MSEQQMTFEQYVDEWKRVDREAKRLTETAMNMRKAIAASVKEARGSEWKEGANTIPMADGRKITVTHKINRSVDASQIDVIREEYAALNDRPVAFDDLLKVKYELSVSSFRKLDGRALHIISDMITAKEGSPEVVIKD